MAGGAEVTGITADGVRWRDADGEHETPAGAVFATAAASPDSSLADGLAARGIDVTIVGDARAGAGLLEHAMRTALESAVIL